MRRYLGFIAAWGVYFAVLGLGSSVGVLIDRQDHHTKWGWVAVVSLAFLALWGYHVIRPKEEKAVAWFFASCWVVGAPLVAQLGLGAFGGG
jgi:quinol-cytochrome oxidoreductase complex cytochrome b subunit